MHSSICVLHFCALHLSSLHLSSVHFFILCIFFRCIVIWCIFLQCIFLVLLPCGWVVVQYSVKNTAFHIFILCGQHTSVTTKSKSFRGFYGGARSALWQTGLCAWWWLGFDNCSSRKTGLRWRPIGRKTNQCVTACYSIHYPLPNYSHLL